MERLLLEENKVNISNQLQNKTKTPAFNVYFPDKCFISINDAMVYVGDNSTYSKYIITIFTIIFTLFSFITMGWVLFMGNEPQYNCINNKNILESCKKELFCKFQNNNNKNYTIIYDDDGYNSVIEYYGLYCNRQIYIYYANISYFFMLIVGGIIISYISDLKGRRISIIISNILLSIGYLICILSNKIEIWILGIGVVGFAFGGLETVCYVYVCEVSANNFRANATSILTMTWAIAQILLAVINKIVKGWWQLFTFIFFVPSIICLLFSIYFILESPRFSILKGNFKECRNTLKKISIINLRPEFKFRIIDEIPNKNKEYNSFDTIKLNTIILDKNNNINEAGFNNNNYLYLLWFSLLWLFSKICYFFIQIGIAIESTNIILNFSLLGLSELFASIISLKIKKKYNRKTSIIICLIIGGIISLLNNYSTHKELLTFLSKFFLCLSINILLVYTGEYFPTKLRSNYMNICFLMGRVGYIITPFYLYYLSYYKLNKNFQISILFFIQAILCLLIKETFGIVKEDLYDNNKSYELSFFKQKNN